MPVSTPKIILSSTSETAAAFLIRLLTELGLDTDYLPSTAEESLAAPAAWTRVLTPAAPYVVHDPALGDTLPGILAAGQVTVDYALVVTGPSEAAARRGSEAERFHRLVETLAAHDIPHSLLHFPRLAQDRGYCFEKLRPLLGAMPEAEFDDHFASVAPPRLLPSVGSGTPDKQWDDGDVGRASRVRRLRRHALQVTAACGLLSLGWLAAGSQRAAPVPGFPTPLVREVPTAAQFQPPPRSAFGRPRFEHPAPFPVRPGRHGFQFPFDHPAIDRPVPVSGHQI